MKIGLCGMTGAMETRMSICALFQEGKQETESEQEAESENEPRTGMRIPGFKMTFSIFGLLAVFLYKRK